MIVLRTTTERRCPFPGFIMFVFWFIQRSFLLNDTPNNRKCQELFSFFYPKIPVIILTDVFVKIVGLVKPHRQVITHLFGLRLTYTVHLVKSLVESQGVFFHKSECVESYKFVTLVMFPAHRDIISDVVQSAYRSEYGYSVSKFKAVILNETSVSLMNRLDDLYCVSMFSRNSFTFDSKRLFFMYSFNV